MKDLLLPGMRRLPAFFLLLLYFLSSTGITLHAHYCGGNLAALAVFESATCCCDEEEESSDCCDNEVKRLQLADEQVKAEYFRIYDNQEAVWPQSNPVWQAILSQGEVFAFDICIKPKSPPEFADQLRPVYQWTQQRIFFEEYA